MVGFIPFLTLSEHRIQDAQQLAHTGFGFSCCKQKRVKRFYYWIKASSNECRHLQRSSHSSSANKDAAVSKKDRMPHFILVLFSERR